MIKVCVPQAEQNLQHPQAPLPITLRGARLIIVQTNYMTRWEEYDCRSVPVACQINKCLMTLSLPLFNLIRGGTDLLDGWLYSNRLWIWSRGLPALHLLCVLVCSAAAWLLPRPLNCSWPPAGPAVWLHWSTLLQHVWETRARRSCNHICVSLGLCGWVCVCVGGGVFHWWITIKHFVDDVYENNKETERDESLQASNPACGLWHISVTPFNTNNKAKTQFMVDQSCLLMFVFHIAIMKHETWNKYGIFNNSHA